MQSTQQIWSIDGHTRALWKSHVFAVGKTMLCGRHGCGGEFDWRWEYTSNRTSFWRHRSPQIQNPPQLQYEPHRRRKGIPSLCYYSCAGGDPQRLRLGKQRPPRKPLQPTHILPNCIHPPLCLSCVPWYCLLIVMPPVYSIATPHGHP